MSSRKYPVFPIPGVTAVVLGAKGILLVKRDKEPAKGKWSLPGGAIEVGESQEEAVAREVMEETGVVCEVLDLISTADVITHDELGRTEYHFILNNYMARAETVEVRPETPEAEVKWFGTDLLPLSEMPSGTMDVIEKAKKTDYW